VTQTDCRAVLISMKEHIIEALTEGQVVVLDDLGRFQVTLQGKCYPAEMMQAEDFSPTAQIKGHKIVFRPDVKLKKAVAMDFSLKRVSSEVMELLLCRSMRHEANDCQKATNLKT